MERADSGVWEKDERSIFERLAQSPDAWLSTGILLKRAADLVAVELRPIMDTALETRHSHHDLVMYEPFMMLNGFAVENILKGIIVGKTPTKVNPTRLAFNNHKLVDLAEEAGIDCDRNEKDLLERLTKFAVWAGRYPTPLKAENHTSPVFNTSDFNDIDRLFERFCQILENENPNPTITFGN